MLDEIHKLCNMLEEELKSTDVNEEGEILMELALKFNISIVNALWVLLVGEKLELNDDRLIMIVKVFRIPLTRMAVLPPPPPSIVVSIGHSHAFFVVFVSLDCILTTNTNTCHQFLQYFILYQL